MRRVSVIAGIAIGLVLLGWSVVHSQTTTQTNPRPDVTQMKGPREFPSGRGRSQGKAHNHQAVAMRVVWGYTNDWSNPNNYYMGVEFSGSSSGAPQFQFGDSFAEATAELLDQGYQVQALQYDGGDFGGWGGNVVFVK